LYLYTIIYTHTHTCDLCAPYAIFYFLRLHGSVFGGRREKYSLHCTPLPPTTTSITRRRSGGRVCVSIAAPRIFTGIFFPPPMPSLSLSYCEIPSRRKGGTRLVQHTGYGFLTNLPRCSVNAVCLSPQKKKNQTPQTVILIIIIILYIYISDTCAAPLFCSVWPLLLLLLLLLLLWRIIRRRVCGIGF